MQLRDFVKTQNEKKVIKSCYLHWVPLVLKAKHQSPKL
jgi:hypothetical protein